MVMSISEGNDNQLYRPISDSLLAERYGVLADRTLLRLTPLYLAQTPHDIATLKKAHLAQDHNAFWITAHTLHGNNSAICAKRLEDMSKELENFGRKQNWSQIDLLLPIFLSETQHLLDYLSQQTDVL